MSYGAVAPEYSLLDGVARTEHSHHSAAQNEASDDELQPQDHDDRREIETTHRWQVTTRETEQRLGDLPENLVEAAHRPPAAQREPREDDAHEDDENVEVENLTENFAHGGAANQSRCEWRCADGLSKNTPEATRSIVPLRA